MSDFPALDVIPPVNQAFVKLYDLSSVPQIAINANYSISGPSSYTEDLLSFLATKDIRATFFVVGSRVKERPAVLLDTFMEGHQIGFASADLIV
ncbi:chitin deacetylase [Kappamyces sp. JEL0680]|nr:chitin deacetylase [Kappamyces sp. JEL0680]